MTDFTPLPTWLGPGLTIHWQAAFQGPLLPGSFVQLELWGANNEEILWNVEVQDQAILQQGSKIIGLEVDQSGIQWNASAQKTKSGDQVRFIYRLRDPNGQVLEQDQITAPLDTTVGLPVPLRDLQHTIGSQGGFTATDRANANITQMGVSLPLPGLGVAQDIASGLTGFFTSPPRWAHQVLESVELQGSGDLTRPGAGRSVNAYGAQVSFLFVPPEMSVTFGIPAVYLEPICRLTVVRTGLGSLEYYDESADFLFTDQRMMWGTPFPVRISYTVFPGCVVRLYWLHLAPDWWPFT